MTQDSTSTVVAVALGLAFVMGACLTPKAADAALSSAVSCHLGAYRLSNGRIVDIAPAADGALRWRDLDGATGSLKPSKGGWHSFYGWTDRRDGTHVSFGPCRDRSVVFGRFSGTKMPLLTMDTTFVSRGTRLAGRLVLPPGSGAVPIVVLLHGSERDPARQFNFLQRLFPLQGVGAFVYDKRGTGASGGSYTQDFSTLADDAVAALGEARRLAGSRSVRFGFQGPSQGGWVAPLAAARASPAFVIVSFGLAVSVIDEDQEAIAFAMRLRKHREEDVQKALEIGRAAAALFESGFTSGFEEFERVRSKYRKEPWYKDVRGDFTYLLLDKSTQELRAMGPQFRFQTPFRYDPMPTLERLTTPQLWVLGGQDLDAPSGETVRRLKGLVATGKPITIAVYPDAEHGMTRFEEGTDGARVSTRYEPGYFRMMADFARSGRLRAKYGGANITNSEAVKPTRTHAAISDQSSIAFKPAAIDVARVRP